MTQKPMLEKLFSFNEEELRNRFRGWERDLPHQGEKGGLRERRVSDFLSSLLPKRYGIGQGHIVDSQGGISPQTDIVVYDAAAGFTLPIDSSYSVFPCECVHAAIEVKSKLTASNAVKERNRGTIFQCMKATEQLKSLARKSEYHDLPPILSIVFAYSSKWANKPDFRVIWWFRRFHKEYGLPIPDVICVLDPGFVIVPPNPTGYWRESDKEFPALSFNPLLFFFSRLLAQMTVVKTTPPDLWNEYSTFLAGKKIAIVHRLE